METISDGARPSIRRGPSNHPAEMACEANLHSKVLVQCGQGMVGAVGDLGSAFPVFPALLSCSNPVGFMGLCATANRCPPLWSVHSCLLPRVGNGQVLMTSRKSNKTAINDMEYNGVNSGEQTDINSFFFTDIGLSLKLG